MSHSREDMIALYDSFDKNSDGNVTCRELRDGIRSKLCPDLTDQQAAAMFLDFDADESKGISRPEFLDQMCDKICRKVGFNKTFKEWDKDNSGYLTFDEVKGILNAQGFDDEKVQSMYEAADKDSDGKVTCEEFLKLM